MSDGHFTPQMQPNSQNQRWSNWIFIVKADPRRRPTRSACKENFRKWVKMGFGGGKDVVGRGKIDAIPGGKYRFQLQIEGPPAHDPEYRLFVQRQFAEHFVVRGFGSGAVLETMEVAILAGSSEDGTPPSQMIVMPTLDLKSLLEE